MRVIRLLFVLLATIAVTGQLRAECPPVISVPVKNDPLLGVTVRWFHPGWNADTVSASQSSLQGGFHVSDGPSDQWVAIRLSENASGKLISTINTYFFASESVSASEWQEKAEFSWSIYSDSADRPWLRRSPEWVIPLGDEPSLRSGDWQVSDLNWRIPDTLTDAVWLVGRWSGASISVVRIGSGGGVTVLPTQVGVGDSIGSSGWIPINSPQLLIDIILLESDGTCLGAGNGTNQSTGLSDSPIGFVVRNRIVTEAVQGWWRDPNLWSINGLCQIDTSRVVGEELYYEVAAVCDSDTSGWRQSDMIVVSAQWPLTIEPAVVAAVVDPANPSVLFVELSHGLEDTLVITVPNSIALQGILDKNAGSESNLQISITADNTGLLKDSILRIELNPSVEAGMNGIYAGILPISSVGSKGGAADNYLIYIELQVDTPTGIGPDAGDSPSQGECREGLIIRGLTNPFTDRIDLEISGVFDDFAMIGNDRRLSDESGMEGQIVIVNVLGQQMASQFFRSSYPDAVFVTFFGTDVWPSGVYLCLVRWGMRSNAIRLIHLK